MIRSEYFIRLREVLLELDDRTLGVYLWHYTGPFPLPASEIPPQLSFLELHDRLFPNMTPEDAQRNVGHKPTAQHLQHVVDHRSSRVLDLLKNQGKALARYEDTIRTIGQQARDILQGDATALSNVEEQRRRQLNVEWTRLEGWALEAEKTAAERRQRADLVRAQLDATLAKLEQLAQVKKGS